MPTTAQHRAKIEHNRDFDLDSEALGVAWVFNLLQVTGAEYERRY